METKREKFIRLAEKRMQNTLHQIDLLANLSNKQQYSYTEEDVSKMLKALKEAVSNVEHSFKRNGVVRKFSLR